MTELRSIYEHIVINVSLGDKKATYMFPEEYVSLDDLLNKERELEEGLAE